LLFTCSDTFAVGCVIYPQYTLSQMDRQADNIMLTIADHRLLCGRIS